MSTAKQATLAKPYVGVDTVILTVHEQCLKVLLVKRDCEPFQNQWSLIGGFIDVEKDHDLEATAMRKLLEKTGVVPPYLEQYKTVGNAGRDPRGWSMSTVYFALIAAGDAMIATTANTDSQWFVINSNLVKQKLAFDHQQLLQGCIERLRSKVLYTALPLYLLPPQFTLSELQQMYEIILDKKIDRKAFQRRMLNAGVLKETDNFKASGRRPARIYKRVDAKADFYFSRMMSE